MVKNEKQQKYISNCSDAHHINEGSPINKLQNGIILLIFKI